MTRLELAFIIGLTLLVSSCGSIAGGPSGSSTGVASTVSIATVKPGFGPTSPPGYTPLATTVQQTSTPVPTLSSGLGITELKYRILAQFPDFFFCDPDYYPVARADELELARQTFPKIQSNTEEFKAILSHNNLGSVTHFTDAQKLLIYQEHKKLAAIPLELTDDAYQFQIQVAKTEGSGEYITGLIDGQGSITVLERTTSFATCPICLAAGTLIDTPTGPLPVQSIHIGDLVWTLDEAGRQVARQVIRIGKTIVPANHQVVHLVLEDGRQLWVSPGHPTLRGLIVGQLQIGDRFDGSYVRSAERVRYMGLATYDLLPDGEPGFYWANGILLASTLKPSFLEAAPFGLGSSGP